MVMYIKSFNSSYFLSKLSYWMYVLLLLPMARFSDKNTPTEKGRGQRKRKSVCVCFLVCALLKLLCCAELCWFKSIDASAGYWRFKAGELGRNSSISVLWNHCGPAIGVAFHLKPKTRRPPLRSVSKQYIVAPI